MPLRGVARTYTSALGSNYLIKRGPGSLYAVHGYLPAGGSVKLENTNDLGATPNLNAVSSNATLAYYGPAAAAGVFSVVFTPGAGFDDGLVVAATSNARATIVYE